MCEHFIWRYTPRWKSTIVLFLGLARRRDSSGHMDRNMVDADVFCSAQKTPLLRGCVRAQVGEFKEGFAFLF